jgi:two-component system sensor histidine kinase KdpD
MNAIKYGGHGITIAYGYEDHGSYYKLSVYNNGPVIPREKRDTLFEKFRRADKVSDHEGMGMGLFLTKEILNKHGGDIWYEEMEHGAAFIFTLPKGK